MKSKRIRTLQSLKQAERERRKLIINSSLAFVCVVLFFVAVGLFLRLNFLQINSIEIVGAETIDQQSIKQKISQEISGSYIGAIPRTNSFLYPKSAIKANLLNDFKKIDTLEIELIGLKQMQVTIKEKTPSAFICDGFKDDSQKCYSVDKNGYVFEESPFFSDGIYPHYYLDLSEKKPEEIIGKILIDADLFAKLQKMISMIQDSHISVTGLLFTENSQTGDSQFELYIKNPDETDAVVYFDSRTPFEKTASNLILFLNNSNSNKKGTGTDKVKTATSTVNFEYINLRYGNNIFYVTK